MKELEDFTIIIQGNSLIKVKTDLFESNLTELYDKNTRNSTDFNLLGFDSYEDMIDILNNCLGYEVDKENRLGYEID